MNRGQVIEESAQMPGNNEINWRCPVYLCMKFFLCLARHFYVRSILIFVGTLLATVTWPQFDSSNTVFYYCLAMTMCLVLTFVEKGFLDPKSSWLRKEAYMEKRFREIAARRVARQEARRQAQQRSRQLLHLAPWLRAEGAIEILDPMEEMVLFLCGAENGESSNSASMSPAHQAASSDLRYNLPQTSTDPSMQPTCNIPVDNVTNKGPRNAEPSASGSNVPQCSTDPSIQSAHSMLLDVTKEKLRSDEPLQQAESSDSGSNVPQSSTDPSTQSTHSSPLDVLDEEPRSDESLQQAVSSDSGTTLPQSTHGAALDDVTEQ